MITAKEIFNNPSKYTKAGGQVIEARTKEGETVKLILDENGRPLFPEVFYGDKLKAKELKLI